MSATTRRIIYVITYELVAILAVTLGLSLLGFGGGQSGAVAIASSTVAVIWNFIWTSMFEAWERRQESQTRTVKRRIVHSIGFEGGLMFSSSLLLPGFSKSPSSKPSSSKPAS